MTVDEVKQSIAFLPTFITNEDIECYYKYANLISNGGIVDLGTGWAKSMLALGLSNPSNKILTCDPGNYPIYQNWAKDQTEYEYKINQIINQFSLQNTIIFIPRSAEDLISFYPHPALKIDLLHIDNWVEMNQVDSSELLKKYIDVVKEGGYILIRNYGRGDREPFTKSVDQATKGLKRIEQMGLIEVYQK